MVIADLPEMLTVAQAARVLGVTPERMRQISDAGQLETTRTGLGRLFRVEDVEALRLKRAEGRAVPV